MMIKSIKELTIYESPDGGKTIYSRTNGSPNRTLVQQSTEEKIANRWVSLQEVVALAETEPSLNDALEKVEMLYTLIKDQK